MYIIELFIKWLNKNKRGEGATCRHNFMPVDSTGNVLACTKCGFVVKKKGQG